MKPWKDLTYKEREAWVAAARAGKPRPGSVDSKLAELREQFERRRPRKGQAKRRQLPGGAVTRGGARYAVSVELPEREGHQ